MSRMQFYFLAPWWLWLLNSGKRFSLRRMLVLAVATFVLAELGIAAYRYAFGGDVRALVDAFGLAVRVTIVVTAAATVRPLFEIARDSLLAQRLVVAPLRDTSNGFVLWVAALCALALLVWNERIFPAHAWFARLETQSGPQAGPRFFVGAFLVLAVVLYVARAVVLSIGERPPGEPRLRRERLVPNPAYRPQTHMNAAPPAGPAMPSPPPRPARILSMDAGPPGERTGPNT